MRRQHQKRRVLWQTDWIDMSFEGRYVCSSSKLTEAGE